MPAAIPWQLVRTENPDEFSFLSRHDQEALSKLRPDDFPKAGVTLYSDFRLKEPARATPDRYGSYVYAEAVDTGNAEVGFLWVKVRSNTEIATPFETREESRRHPWLSVLEWIDFGQENGMPASQVGINNAGEQATYQAPRWVVRYGYRPGDTYMTRMTIRRFISHKPFPDHEMESDEPHPSEVSWDLVPGSHGSMGECLHDDIEVPKSSAAFRSVSATGNLEASSPTAASGQFFPRTNHITWQDYTVNEVAYANGQYVRTETTYHAPYPPPITEKES